MSANVLIIAVLVALAAAAAAVRMVAGPVADLGDGASLYAAAKFGSGPALFAPPVEMAASGSPPALALAPGR